VQTDHSDTAAVRGNQKTFSQMGNTKKKIENTAKGQANVGGKDWNPQNEGRFASEGQTTERYWRGGGGHFETRQWQWGGGGTQQVNVEVREKQMFGLLKGNSKISRAPDLKTRGAFQRRQVSIRP